MSTGYLNFTVDPNNSTSPRSGSFTVQGDTQTLVHTVSQDGMPNLYPNISLPTSSFSLGNALVNAQTFQTVTVQNTGTGVLYIGNVSVVSGTTEFGSTIQYPTIPAGGTGYITVTLLPTSTGSKAATVRNSSNDPNHATTDVTFSAMAIAGGGGATDFSWSTYTTLSQGIWDSAAVAVNQYIYVFGANNSSTNAFRLDPTTNSWTPLPQSPHGHSGAGAAAIGSKIYLVGGAPGSNIVDIYDTAANTWSSGSAMVNGDRDGVAVAALNNKLYVCGGRANSTATTALVEEYDPATNTWTRKADMPTARSYASAAVVGSQVYVIGGFSPSESLANESFDPVANQWLARENIITPRAVAAIAVYQSRIYVIGGRQEGNSLSANAVEEYDPSKPDAQPGWPHTAWSSKNPIQSARMGAGAGIVNNTVYVIGGQYLSPSYATTPVLTVEAGAFSAAPSAIITNRSLAFGDVPVGNASELVFTVQNAGNAPLNVSYTVPNGSYLEWRVWNSVDVLSPGQTASFRMRFMPPATGNRAATLRFTTNDSQNPTIDIALSGRGTAAVGLPSGQSFQLKSSSTLQGAGQPLRIGLTGGSVYVTTALPAQLLTVDPLSGASLATAAFSTYSDSSPWDFSILGGFAYVPLYGSASGQLGIVNLTSNGVSYVPSTTSPVAAAGYGGFVYLVHGACWSDGHPDAMQILDSTSATFTTTLTVGRISTGVAIDPSTGRGYVVGGGCGGAGDTADAILPHVFDANTNTVTGTLDIPLGSNAISIAGTRAYILGASLVNVVDILTNQILARVPVDQGAFTVSATPSFVFVPNYNGTIQAISTSNNYIVATLSAPGVSAIASDPQTNSVYLASSSARTISVFQFLQPGFTMDCSGPSVATVPGASGSQSCTVGSVGGYSAAVGISCSGLPQGVSCGLNPQTTTPAANSSTPFTLSLTTPADIPPGIYPFEVVGTDGLNNRHVNLSLVVSTCSFSLGSSSQTVPAAGGPLRVSVSATTGCTWTVTGNPSWITINGTTGGQANFGIAANSGAARSVDLTVAGQIFTVTQSGAPMLSVVKSHPGNFAQGQNGATYTVTVSNAVGAGPTSGTVTVTETVPSGLTLVSMSGTGWTCPGTAANNCTRNDVLNGGANYQAIAVTVNVASDATTPQTNQVSVSGGGSVAANATDPTTITTSQTIAFGALFNKVFGTAPFSVSATATSGLPVSFNSQTTPVCTVSGATVTLVSTGTCTIQATQTGNTNYAAATPVNQTFQVTQATQTITFGTLSNKVFGTAPFTISATAGSGLAVSFTSQTTPVCTVSGSTVTLVSGGTCTIQATQAGNSNYAAATPVNRSFQVTQATPAALRFVPITPCRIADTRSATGPFGGPTISGGTSRDFIIPNSACGVPASAQAYSLNVAVVPAVTLGYLTLWPAGQTRLVASTLNSLDGRIKSNAAIVPAGTNGAVSVFASDTTNVILDINGYFVPATDPTGLAFYPITPCRIADTRTATAPLGGPSLGGGTSRTFPILSSTCNLPATAQAYSLNFAVVPSGSLGYLTAWPTGQTRPVAASLNALTGAITANAAIVPAGTSGSIDVFASNTTNLVIDINGYFAPMGTGGLSLYGVSPCRVLDTRQPAGSAAITTLDVAVSASACGIPASARAHVMSVTVVPQGSLGYLTLWPQGQTRPVVSTLNALDGAITSNLAIVPTANGSISAFASDLTHLIADISGYFGQ
jgi:N-acetylneuraminic acid mutarotase